MLVSRSEILIYLLILGVLGGVNDGKLPRSSITYNFQVKCAIFKKGAKDDFRKNSLGIAADPRLDQS
jgi:hypothetical protein